MRPTLRYTIHGVHRKPDGPLRTLQEIAELFGVTPSELQQALAHPKVPAPKPFISYGPNVASPRRSYYELRAMRRWWDENNKDKP